MNQSINLSSLLTIPGTGRGRGIARGHKNSQGQGHSRRAFAQTDAPPGFSPNEVAEAHRDKR